MRPHKLTMKAFGPFAKETIVDFDAMGDNIYLIAGDTGAGKTTIFDAIVYALYGTASGGGRSKLHTEELHSEYAREGDFHEEMKVELEFSNCGKNYSVTRTLRWGVGGRAKKPDKESTLCEGGNVIVHGKGQEDKDDVTTKIEEIIGLDADQFRQIIMLAQGEFQKFLNANSKDRGEILGQLYDNARHKDLESRLKAAKEAIKSKQNIINTDAKAQLDIFVCPDDMTEDEKENLKFDHPELIRTVENIVDKMDGEVKKLGTKIEEKKKESTKLSEEKAKAEQDNELLNNLDTAKEKLSNHQLRKTEMDALQKKVDLASAAEKVVAKETAKNNTVQALGKLEKTIADLETKKKELEEKVINLKEAKELVEEENDPKIAELNAEKTRIENVLGKYDDLETKEQDLQVKENALAEAIASLNKANDELKEKQDKQKNLENTLARLASAGDAAVENAQHDYDAKNDKLDKLKELKSAIEKIGKQEEVEKLEETLREISKKTLEAEEEHLKLKGAFMSGQAGFLAKEMINKLESENEVACPVCGSVHKKADIGNFAKQDESIPSKEEVDEAWSTFENLRRQENEARNSFTNAKATCDNEKKNAEHKAKELIGVSAWDEISDGVKVDDAIAECNNLLNAANEKLEASIKEKKEKEKAAEEKTSLDNEIEAISKNITELENNKNGKENEKTAAKAALDECKKSLSGYPDSKQEADKKIGELKKQIAELEESNNQAAENYNNSVNEQSSNLGELKTANSEKAGRESERDKTTNEYTAVLEQQGFKDESAYKDALSPEGNLLDQNELETWLQNKRAELTEYGDKEKELDSSVKTLENQAKGKVKVDLTALNEKIADIAKKLEDLGEADKKLGSELSTNKSVLDKLKELKGEMSKLDAVYEKISPLSDSANGKLSFDRYVLGGFFGQIIEQANLHLQTMTDGELYLIQAEDEDGRKKGGLGLKVQNSFTQAERNTAALSGGQTFETSLALALGLSNVVQMNSASTINIESMFIDEGFGSLDGARLDKAIQVLKDLSADQKQIGIISHVQKFDEFLPNKIRVTASDKGSSVRVETEA